MEDFSKILKDIQKRLDEQKNELQNMKNNIIKSVNENVNEKFSALDTKYQQLEKKIIEQQKHLNYQDRFNRRKNIILHGVHEEEANYHDLENLVVETLNTINKFKFETQDLEYVTRIGKKNGNTRPVLVTFITMSKKIHLLKINNNHVT
ncbi:hypothetical protein RR48_13950 [Papilio machaon]|uniref:Endonuclease-reverse transcriptase n=1 Tax=Papilio machaon TaxID=76193 RepID=A0A194RI32_PAPMA|nr:hypothetical protein RR48_13950 [Papilio machaon]